MKSLFFATLLLLSASAVFSQTKFQKDELSLNGFRNPSIGLEYRHQRFSTHVGYYTTAFEAGEYTNFFKAGVTYWFLPVDKKEIPSSFYAGASYLRGLTRDYKGQNAVGIDAGFRWMVWKGLNVRLGAMAIAASGHDLKINPTPGISYAFKL